MSRDGAQEFRLKPTTSKWAFLDAHPGAYWYFSSKPCECYALRQARAKMMGAENALTILDKQIPEVYRVLTFESFDHLPDMMRAGKEDLRAASELFGNNELVVAGEPRSGLVACGARGRCKTSLLTAALRMRASQGQSCAWRSWIALLRDIRGTFDSDGGPSEDTILDELVRADVLLVDDFGPARQWGDVTDFARRIAFDLFSERYNHLKPTLITSNQDYGWLHDNFDERLLERLSQLYHWIELSEDSVNMRVAA